MTVPTTQDTQLTVPTTQDTQFGSRVAVPDDGESEPLGDNADLTDVAADHGAPVGTHFFHQRYLYAFATQAEVTHYIRTQALPEESARISESLARWTSLQPRVHELITAEAGLAETIGLAPIPPECNAQVQKYAQDALFQKTFSGLPIGFGVVEIDKLIAAQRTVNLDYVERLRRRFPSNLGVFELLEICVSPSRPMEPIQHLEIGPNVHVFSSPNSDIRFLGSFTKALTPGDLEAAVSGGLPVAAVISFVGYGGAPINVIQAGDRIVLNNGFHRAFALREAGVTHIPVVIQLSRNPALDFPPLVAGLPREYLLGHQRPVLMKDFFEADLAMTLRIRDRLKMVMLSVNLGQHEVPA